MTFQKNHDDLNNALQLKQLMAQISTRVDEDLLNDIMLLGDRPEVLAVLVFRLAQERAKTNQLLEEINKKLDMLTKETLEGPKPSQSTQLLPPQDQAIIELIEKNGKACAEEIKEALGYKGLNAASQRLNKLCKEGLLDKIRVGQKVYFIKKK